MWRAEALFLDRVEQPGAFVRILDVRDFVAGAAAVELLQAPNGLQRVGEIRPSHRPTDHRCREMGETLFAQSVGAEVQMGVARWL